MGHSANCAPLFLMVGKPAAPGFHVSKCVAQVVTRKVKMSRPAHAKSAEGMAETPLIVLYVTCFSLLTGMCSNSYRSVAALERLMQLSLPSTR